MTINQIQGPWRGEREKRCYSMLNVDSQSGTERLQSPGTFTGSSRLVVMGPEQ
jgi:hypothetical protein